MHTHIVKCNFTEEDKNIFKLVALCMLAISESNMYYARCNRNAILLLMNALLSKCYITNDRRLGSGIGYALRLDDCN